MAAADISSVGTPAAGVRASTTPTTPSLAQNFPSTEPTFEFQGDERTIDNQVITHLAQDARGLIWIGTELGLFRYDGYRFRKFTHKLGDPFSLAGNSIYSLYAAPDGRLWVGTLNDGVSVFDPATERFENFRHDEKIPDSLGEGNIWALIGDGRGGMWIASEQGLNHLPAGAKRFTHFKHSTDPRSLMNDKVRSLLLDKAGRLQPRMEFRSEFLHAFMETERVKSDKPVDLRRGSDRFTADSMDFDNLSRVMQLTGRVKGTLVPAPAR